MTRILVLAGTAEARALAKLLAGDARWQVTASLAGVTTAPAAYPVPVRRGGFGGTVGLAQALQDGCFDALIDATHPFATTISEAAMAASRQTGVPLCRLARPAWPVEPSWTVVPDVDAAAACLPPGAAVFLAVGARALQPFARRNDLAITTRMIEAPNPPVPADWRLVLARPPFPAEAERTLFEELGITHLVTRNAGGAASRPKLEAARQLGLSVVMVARSRQGPVPPTEVQSPEAALIWLEDRFATSQQSTATGAGVTPS